jgi:DNA-binding MarR family transcriptional regulator
MKKKKKELTPAQSKVLEFIKLFYAKHGIMPTYQEIGAGTGTTDSSAYQTVARLEERGWLRKDRRPRCIKLL